MFKTRCCGCKGLRSCKICETEYGAWQIGENISLKKEHAYIYCPFCDKLWPGWDTADLNLHPNHKGKALSFDGVKVIQNFISPDEELELVKCIDEVPWDLSQSGRYKQNYGPKCNFKKRKVSPKNFEGYPQFTRFIQDRFETLDILHSFQTVEQCSLEYTPQRGSSIDPHIDDCWIWGERIPTLSLLSDSVLTLTYFSGPSARYNLVDSLSYPHVVSDTSGVKTLTEIQKEYEGILYSQNGNTSVTDVWTGESLQTKIGKGEPLKTEIGNCESLMTEIGKGDSLQTEIGNGESLQTEIGNGESLQTEIEKSEWNGTINESKIKNHILHETVTGKNETQETEIRIDKAHKATIKEGEARNTDIRRDNNLMQEYDSESEQIVIRVPMPRRSLIVLYGKARYEYEHSILREDIKSRRVCITYRELTPTFLPFGKMGQMGEDITERAKLFWDHKTNT